MRGWSFPVGRFFGVDVRIHAFFLLLLVLGAGAGELAGVSSGRILVLWLLLLGAVAVREVARSVAACWFGLDLKGVLLLPTGGLMIYGPGPVGTPSGTVESRERAIQPDIQRKMGIVGPGASIGFALLVAAIVLAIAPSVNLVEKPWVTPAHLLRSLVWLNLMLGAVNLLPAAPLDGGRMLNGGKGLGKMSWSRGWAGAWLGTAMVVAGLLMGNLWLTTLGAFLLFGMHMESQGLLVQNESDSVRMRDVMLTQFSTLSASDTLEDAMERAVHTLQDVFPVVRGASLVGAVSRQSIVEALAAEGNSYIQGVMTKSFQTAKPDDSLVTTLRRIMSEQGAQLVPVMEGERIVGIITPQNLSLSMGLLNQSRRMRRIEPERG